MNNIQFSIVTPTFNRAKMLSRMLRHLLTVEGIADCEIIVVNDGSNDDTASVLERYQQEHPELIRVITLSNGGPARARNAGVQAAIYDTILFIDDDVFPRPGMLEQHRLCLEQGFDGSQGVLIWHKEITLTPLIQYIDSRGSQFAFDQIDERENLSGAHVYTGNFAIRRKLVLAVGGFAEGLFDADLAFSAFEDTVLGYALKKEGARLVLNRKAIADHLHHMTENGFLKREYNVGSGTAHLQRKFPEITRDLGLQQKDKLIRLQILLLKTINNLPIVKYLAGYRISMRLRHREAFLRGYRRYILSHPAGKEVVLS